MIFNQMGFKNHQNGFKRESEAVLERESES